MIDDTRDTVFPIQPTGARHRAFRRGSDDEYPRT